MFEISESFFISLSTTAEIHVGKEKNLGNTVYPYLYRDGGIRNQTQIRMQEYPEKVGRGRRTPGKKQVGNRNGGEKMERGRQGAEKKTKRSLIINS